MEKKKSASLGVKSAISVVLIALVLGATAVLFGYQSYKTALEDQLIHTATNLAYTAAGQVDVDSIATYLETGETDKAYERIQERLVQIQTNNDIMYIVVVLPTEEGFYYLYDTDPTDEAWVLGDFQEYYPGDFLDNKANFLAGQEISPIITNEEFGWLLSMLVPILDDEGEMRGYVNVDLSMDEIKEMERDYLLNSAMILAIAAVILAGLFVFLVNRVIVRPIDQLADATGAFVKRREDSEGGEGNRIVIDLPKLDTGDEVGHLYRSIRQMEADIYSYIDNLTAVTAEKERIGAELGVATHIQASMLPSIFPAFPDRSEFDIYATMTPAKEVGGDFYDFFLVDDDHLAVVMADVSGKGVPAALFMVIAKTLIKDHTQAGTEPNQVFTEVNRQLCESNDEGMFVTAWMGVLQISTGHMVFVNAGHNPPLVRHKDGQFEYLKSRAGFVLAGMEGMRYKSGTLDLDVGDTLYLYTDGVTEATDLQEELYGEDRLEQVLNSNLEATPEELLHLVKVDIDAFVGEAPQFDDITMLGLHIKERGKPTMKEWILDATDENMEPVQNFVMETIKEAGCTTEHEMWLMIAIEEIYINIAHYAYAPGQGQATIRCAVDGDPKQVTVQFIDSGKAFNPLEKEDADITLGAEERGIGGLGILMVKQSMDEVTYVREDDQNILTIRKIL